ncbi:DEAD/DEAH box helicase [Bradyrhizobium sp. SSBR45G]|uniref:DEAD/DEAH box helicase n=1 Tax=Bradyrhizobium sp. SSBR45G TaxID=2996008 RepID=UPI0024E15354|nr:DEAD/DEAH box helicase [Bradyrhizobium sp. SSBR45G]
MQLVEVAWLKRELGVTSGEGVPLERAQKLIRAAAILAGSNQQVHRETAFRVATCVYELIGCDELPMDQALRVVLSRLGNFPSFATRSDVDAALPHLPFSLVTEELQTAEAHSVTVNEVRLVFTGFQHGLWSKLAAKERIALSAPTSAGKSFVLQNYLVSVYSDKRPLAIVYIVPTRALIAQVAIDLGIFFQDVGAKAKPDVVVIPPDSDTPLPESAIYVMTQERVQLLLASHPKFAAGIVVVDEAQSISDGARGVLLQWVLDDLLSRNSKAQILFASPNVRNLNVFADIFGLEDVKEVSSSEPAVAQNFLTVKILSKTKGSVSIIRTSPGTEAEVAQIEIGHPLASRVEMLVHVAAKLGQRHANIIYANGAADAEKIAMQLSDLFSDREPTAELTALSDLAHEVVHPNYVLGECIKRSVAFHYSNMPTQLRRAVEDAVAKGHVNYLVCTSTLLQGVNLPVRNIFMCKPERGKSHPLDSTDFWNLSGRAGRLRREFQGNIFLVDYARWKTQPLQGPKEAIVTPAIEATLRDSQAQLISVMRNQAQPGRGDDPALETAFGRLYSDFKQGHLTATLARAGFGESAAATEFVDALVAADSQITLAPEVIRLSPNISAHKQERLFGTLRTEIAKGRAQAAQLVPDHPRDADAFESYALILKRCYELILGLDTARGLHRFHALMALKWMRGNPLPQIIDEQIRRDTLAKDRRTIIRDTLELVENQIRFQAVRLFGCYNTLLRHALTLDHFEDLAANIPSLPLYLEVGASDKTMISFIALGLSRVTAMRLNDVSARKDLDMATALQWLRSRQLEQLGLSPLLLDELRSLLAIK